MRQFFRIFLACLLAFLFGFFILGIFLIGIIGAIGGSQSDTPTVESNSILRINTETSISALAPDEFGSLLSMDEPNQVTLADALHSIQQAAGDSKIKAILIESNGSAIPAAYRNELLAALDSFKKSGKKIYAYGTTIDQGAYQLATAADKIFIHPRGMLILLGYSADITFYKGLMDKLGIEPQIFYAGDFKSATEPYRLSKMSEPNKLQITELLDDFWDLMLNRIEKTRNLDSGTVANIINKGSALLPSSALDHKLVDGLKYEDELYDFIKEEQKWEADHDMEEHSISLADYSSHASSYGSDLVALLHMEGEITGSYNPYAMAEITAEEYLPEIEKLAKNEKVKAVVVHINSPGGDAIVSDKIWHAIKKLNDKKPVVAYMSNVAASGGYYIASACREIVAQARTVTGSIGVFMMAFNAQKLLENKIGLSFDQVQKGKLANYGALNREMTTEEKQLTQSMVNHVYERFLYIVQKGRKLPIEKVKQIAQGRVYSGTDALDIGLVDKLGMLSDALKSAANKAKMNDYKVREYPKRESNPLNNLLKSAQVKMSSTVSRSPELQLWYKNIEHLIKINGKAMARLPFDITLD